MSRLPAAPDLLATAREELLESLLPALPEHLHYQARMIANAMAIAERECAAATSANLAEEQALAARIRGGQADAPVHALLAAMTQQKLSVSNPKLLAQYLLDGR